MAPAFKTIVIKMPIYIIHYQIKGGVGKRGTMEINAKSAQHAIKIVEGKKKNASINSIYRLI